MSAGKKSAEKFARACELFPGGVNSPVRAFGSVGSDPFVVSHGKGAFLYDVDGKEYVDYINSWGPLVLGHAHPEVVHAIQKQAELGTTFGACSEREAELAELIVEFYPSIERLRFVSSGTEAGMSVLRLARGYTQRNKIIKFAGCYHGHADALLVKAGSGVATLGIPGSAGVTQGTTQDTLVAPYNDLAAVGQLFEQFSGEIAAVIVEPVAGNAGLIMPKEDFLSGLRDITSKHSALLIFDEVMTGFRVSLGGAQELYRIKPDLTMLGKVIGGGLPVGAFGGRKDIMDHLAPLGPVYQAGTLSGNPLAMAAGAATLREWTKPGVFERTADIGRQIAAALRQAAEANNVPLTSGSVGTMFGFFFQRDAVWNMEDAGHSDLDMFKRFFAAMLERGIFFAPSQFEAGFVSAAHEGRALETTLRAIKDVFSQLAKT